MTWSVHIPGQPLSINDQAELHTIHGSTRRAWSEAFYTYRDAVSVYVQQAMPRSWQPPTYQPKLGRGFLAIEIDLALTRDMDCDNMLKALLDGVKIGLGVQTVQTRMGGVRLKPIYDDIGFLPRFMSKRLVGKKGKAGVTLTIREVDL